MGPPPPPRPALLALPSLDSNSDGDGESPPQSGSTLRIPPLRGERPKAITVSTILRWGNGKVKGKEKEVANGPEPSDSQFRHPLDRLGSPTQASHPLPKRPRRPDRPKDDDNLKASTSRRRFIAGTDTNANSSTQPSPSDSASDDSGVDSEEYNSDDITSNRLAELRRLMRQQNIDYYVIPSENAHQSEHVAASDRRREYISGFTGVAGVAIVTKESNFLIGSDRYEVQARRELGSSWHYVPTRPGSADCPQDWTEWLIGRVQDSNIGIDARLISYETASIINSKLGDRSSKLVFQPQNLVDLIWKDKPGRSTNLVYILSTPDGKDAATKVSELRNWIKAQPTVMLSHSKSLPTVSRVPEATVITSLPSIAYLLNLHGSDIPSKPLFHAFLFVGLVRAVLFIDSRKVSDEVDQYLKSMRIERQEYYDLWPFLRRREWGQGNVLISPQVCYTVSLLLTNRHYIISPSFTEITKKHESELEDIHKRGQPYAKKKVAFERSPTNAHTTGRRLRQNHNYARNSPAADATIVRQPIRPPQALLRTDGDSPSGVRFATSSKPFPPLSVKPLPNISNLLNATAGCLPLRNTGVQRHQNIISSLKDGRDDSLEPLDLTAKLEKISDYPVAHGGFADVWMCNLVEGGGSRKMGVKVMRNQKYEDNEHRRKIQKRLLREIGVWQHLRHPHVLQLLGICHNFASFPGIVSPWMANGDVRRFLQRQLPNVTNLQRLTLLCQAASGLQYLHEHNPQVVHGDLRAANVLVNDESHCCLADFGLSRVLEVPGLCTATSTFAGSIRWMAPELLESDTVVRSFSTDIYAFGGLMLEILTDHIPFYHLDNDARVTIALFQKESSQRPSCPTLSDAQWEYMQKCWSLDSQNRPPISAVLAKLELFKKALDTLQ